MKRVIVIAIVTFASILFSVSCKPRVKCPAYGNHTYYENVDPSENRS